jgi:hypothetical protein
VAGSNVWSSPAAQRSFADRLAPGRGDSELELRRKREALLRSIEDSRAQIQRIEAEARELDHRP